LTDASNTSAMFSGNVVAKRYNVVSDRRAKTEIQDVDVSSVVNMIENINVRSFQYIDDSRVPRIGFIAQELEGVYGASNCVSTTRSYLPNIMHKVIYDGSYILALKDDSIDMTLINGKLLKLKNMKDKCEYTVLTATTGNHHNILIDRFLPYPPGTEIMIIGYLVEDFKVIDNSDIVASLVTYVQELSRKIERLEQALEK
jgi:hypothetical protein